MRRVVSLWLPTWPTDRLRQTASAWPDNAPLVTAASDGNRKLVAAADRHALSLGLYPGMTLTHAQAMVPGLHVAPADPEGDADALARMAAWCLRYAPLTAPDAPDGIWIDATGCAHLFGGEQAMLADIVGRLERGGATVRAAIADTPGAAHALARCSGAVLSVVPSGGGEAALSGLPVSGLRLPPDIIAALRRLGFDNIGQLAATPRAPLVRRFGPQIALRLDQAFGRVFEPIQPVLPPEMLSERRCFVEPLLTAEAFAVVIADLAEAVCAALDKTSQGARRLDLLFARVDGAVQAIRIGTAKPSRDAKHLARLLGERLEQVDPGLGVEAMTLAVPLAETLRYTQASGAMADGRNGDVDIAALVDRIENRLGAGRIYRIAPVESDVPERSLKRVPPLSPRTGKSWPRALPRPVRLLDPPQPVDAMALLPDQPPVAFTWRRHRFRIRRADGPERIFGEWWRRSAEVPAVRDYFAVEDEDGRRFWLFRRGDGADPATGDLRWFLHGFF